MEVSFSFELVTRGYHVYKDTQESCIGEELVCKRERHNVYGPFAVAVLKADNVVGHIPRLFSAACYVFLGRPGSRILCTVIGHRKYSGDLPQGGMEIPCRYIFHGEKSMITKLEVLLSENNNQLSATSEPQAKTSSKASQKDCSPVPASPTTSTCSEHDSLMEHQNKTEATHNSQVSRKRNN